MTPDRLYLLTNVHSCLVSAAGLPEGSRPYSVQSHLTEIERQIMEEVKKDTSQPKNNDDIPF